jgi:hypothetical protein
MVFGPKPNSYYISRKNNCSSRNIGTILALQLGILTTRSVTIRGLSIAPNGGWVILQEKNNFIAENIPPSLRRQLDLLRREKREIREVVSAPKRGWVVLHDNGDYTAKDIDPIWYVLSKWSEARKIRFTR